MATDCPPSESLFFFLIKKTAPTIAPITKSPPTTDPMTIPAICPPERPELEGGATAPEVSVVPAAVVDEGDDVAALVEESEVGEAPASWAANSVKCDDVHVNVLPLTDAVTVLSYDHDCV